MASTRALGGRWLNLVGRANAMGGLTVTDEHSLFLKGNLCDGTGKPFRFNTTGDDMTMYVDLQAISNGEFDTAFVGGLPAAEVKYLGLPVSKWSKTGGATLVRNTVNFKNGPACLEVQGTAGVDAAVVDVTMVAGETWHLNMASRNSAGVGNTIIRAFDLNTRKFLTAAGAWQVASAALLSHSSATYDTVSVSPFTVEARTATYPQETTVRFVFYANGANGAFYDEIELWPVPNFSSIHGHNISSGVTASIVASTNDPPLSNRGEITLRRPAAYGVMGGPVAVERFVGIEFTDAALNTGDAGGTSIAIGEWVLGSSLAISRRQNYGMRVSYLDPQQEESTEAGPRRRHALTEGGRRRLRLSFTENSAAAWKEFRDRVAGITRNGLYPIVFVPSDDDPDLVVLGRIPAEFAADLQFIDYYDGVELVIDEMPMPTWVP